MTDYPNGPGGEEAASKTQRKKEMDALQDLGRELVALSRDTLKQMNLPEDLLTAVLDYKRFTANGALRRQMQYIGKLMRSVDPEPIRQHLAMLKGESAEHTAWLHLLERWRDRLVGDDEALGRFIGDYPEADPQQLRTLVRNARKEQQEGRAPKAYRQLFQTLKTLIAEPGQPRIHHKDSDEEDEA